MSDSIHFYEPRLGHGLPHDPFNAIVGPRPIGWIASHSATGALNNIEQTREFVWNLATRDLAEAMNQTCQAVPPEVSEFALAGLTPAPSRVVAVPRVQESPVSFECRCTQIVQLQAASGEQISTWLVLGEVVAVHIAKSLLKDGVYDTAAAGHILRGGGPADYFSVGPEQLFRMHRPR
jgi:flavin reductase (DIM6/NTAB) family NADH-FMN oxidoreductase RutF